MVYKIFPFVLFIISVNNLSAQSSSQQPTKPPIDTSVFDKWPSVRDGGISNDGKYAFYTIANQPVGQQTLTINEIRGKWKQEVINGSDARFSNDSRLIIYKIPHDSLALLSLPRKEMRYIPGVRDYKLFMQNNQEWMAYQGGSEDKALVMYNLTSGRKQKFADVISYTLSPDGNILALIKERRSDTTNSQSLTWVNLLSRNAVEVWKGKEAGNCIFDKSGKQLAFMADDENGHAIWHYQPGMEKAHVLVHKGMPGIAANQEIGPGDNWRFSTDGERLFWSLTERARKLDNNAVKVNIWHYQDARLQSQQLSRLQEYPVLYNYVVNIPQEEIFQLTGPNERLAFVPENNDENVLVAHCEGDENEGYWNTHARQRVYLVSTMNGKRTLINPAQAEWLNHLQISPAGKYVVYYDSRQRNYFSYEIATGVYRNITKNIHANWLIWYADELPMAHKYSVGLSGWMENDEGVLINGRYDIWLVDPQSAAPPKNLTNGIGNKTQTIFYPAVDKSTTVHSRHKQILLKVFNRGNKENGFYALTIGDGLTRLHMGPYAYGGSYLDYSTIADGIKSTKANHHFLVLRESASESPNYFYTRDFRTFEPVSNVHPEQHYNWLHTALYTTYKLPDGNTCQGVLYKPENFDSTKQYPVIIYFYESEMSDKLHNYGEPAFSVAVINIPYYVSNGYLVYTPDIHYETGKTGESALRSVLAAASYLAGKPWVDAKRIAVHGHSMGGYETNYVITHSNIFAAAVSAAGMSDLVSDFGGIWGAGGIGRAGTVEMGQDRLGCPPWKCPDVYVKNSPVFYVNQVTTPLLMMHNPNDGAVPFSQGIEFYVALRRCGKRVWLLEYEGENHMVIDKAARKDYTTRMKQFLDHYLKGAPQPVWMSRGIPARMKGIETGLELDHSSEPPVGASGGHVRKKATGNEEARK